MSWKTRDNHGILKTQQTSSSSPTAVVSTESVTVQGFGFRRQEARHHPDLSTSVRQWTQDEESILLLPDPLEKSADSRHSQCLGGHGAEAEVELKAVGHLQRETEHKSPFEHTTFP